MTIDIIMWLCSDNYRTYNVRAAQLLGSINAAIYLNELVQRWTYHSDRDELIDDAKRGPGWFFYTEDKCSERTAMSSKEQRNAINELIRHDLIQQQSFGVPCKRHFRINIENLEEFFSKNISSSAKRANWICQKGKLDLPKGQTEPKENEPPIHTVRTQEKNQNKDTPQAAMSVSSFSDQPQIATIRSPNIVTCYDTAPYAQESTTKPRPACNVQMSLPIEGQENQANRRDSKPIPKDPEKTRKKLPITDYVQHGEYVRLLPQELEAFIVQYGHHFISSLIEAVNDWCVNNRPNGYLYNGYSAAFRTWIRKGFTPPAKALGDGSKTPKQIANEVAEASLKEYDHIRIDVLNSEIFIILKKGDARGVTIEYTQKGFGEQLENTLRKYRAWPTKFGA